MAVICRRVILFLAIVMVSGWVLSSDPVATPQPQHSTQANRHSAGETDGLAEQAPAIEAVSSADATVRADSQVRRTDTASAAVVAVDGGDHSSVALPFVLSRPFDPDHHHTFSLLI